MEDKKIYCAKTIILYLNSLENVIISQNNFPNSSYLDVSKTLRLTQTSNKLNSRMFSSAGNIEQEYEEITEEEKQKYRDQWGLKFNDECIKFEKEWEKIAEEKNEEQAAHLSEELNDHQRRKVEFLADKVLELNVFESRYLAVHIRERVKKVTGINPLKLNMDWPSVRMDADGTWPPLNPNWFKQQELMSQIGPLMGNFGGGGAAQDGGDDEEDEEQEEEEQVEKTSFDIELTSFEPKSKIKLIKEVRTTLGLGLKDAKEMVESAPCWIKKEMKKDDAEALAEKLKSLGAEVKMV